MRKILLLILLCLGGISLAQDNLDPRLSEQINMLEESTETLRGLAATEDVVLAFPSRADVSAYLMDSIAETYTPEVLASELAFYQAFGFIATDYDLVASLTALYSDQVAGYYDTEAESMNVISSTGETPETALPLLDQIIYVHEYTHALQDQYFDIDTFMAGAEGDAYLARLALIEGDATTVMSLYSRAVARANPLLTLFQLGTGLLQMGNVTLPADTPAIFAAELNFPYLQGQTFVAALIEDGGWEAVNAAYSTNPPLSTEQILHPETYLAGEAPLAVSPIVPVLEGWTITRSGVLGEFYLREWLQALGAESENSRNAAEGWGGDSYAVLSSAQGAAFALHIQFDTQQDESEFVETLALLNMPILSTSENIRCWQGAAVLCLNVSANGLRLSSAQTEATARAILQD